MQSRLFLIALAAVPTAISAAPAPAPSPAPARRPLVVIDERATVRTEPPPHGAIGTSTAYRISDGVPGRTMEFRKRVLHPGAAIGAHRIAHDEVYYVIAGAGEVTSGTEQRRLSVGMAAYLYAGETVGIRQVGSAPLTLIVSYPIVPK
ncbi:cupin domain-containing protein [Sphingomonas montana]|uniref:cupin domain-containing protein n=1 Tax=Sphingomonas montana TaxID=1843236 RepID=UPI00101AE41B|nr:cupin domain-containing protein [Sphingomonas montana]